MKKIFELDFRGRKLIVETGELAKQSNGSVLVRFGDTAVLTASVMSKNPINTDFFPLTVLFVERLYSVGKIPGGFIKREGRPTENATLSARLIDRPISPLFEDGFRNEVQVVNQVLSVDQDNAPEMAALFGSSLSLGISDIPFSEPVAGVIVGRVYNEFIKRINNQTSIPIKVIHDAMCKLAEEKTILPVHINEYSATNIIRSFTDWRIQETQTRFRYARSTQPVTETALPY